MEWYQNRWMSLAVARARRWCLGNIANNPPTHTARTLVGLRCRMLALRPITPSARHIVWIFTILVAVDMFRSCAICSQARLASQSGWMHYYWHDGRNCGGHGHSTRGTNC